MTDELKTKVLVYSTVALCVLSVAYNIAQQYVLPDFQARYQRKQYFEGVIMKKGLELHPARHWSPLKQ